MHSIHRREVARKPWLHEYRCNDGGWFRASDLFDASRKLQAAGITGPATSHAANGTVSMVGSIEYWATRAVIERDRGVVSIGLYIPNPLFVK